MMRDLLYGATAGARDFLSSVVSELRQENRLTDDELLREYQGIRGNVPALIAFTEKRVEAGQDPMQEALRYEKKMEALIKQRGGS